MANESVQALGYVELGVSSLADWRTYAQTVLGVATDDAGDALQLRYDHACWRIRIVETGEDDIRCAGFELGSAAQLAALRARLEGQGVEVREATATEAGARGVTKLLVCADPFGLCIELYVGDRRTKDAFVSPRSVSGFVTGEQGLGHMVLAVGDLRRAETFYVGGPALQSTSSHPGVGAGAEPEAAEPHHAAGRVAR
jgi:biphenyl-2,3-diol 1,2-dioxygenase